MVKMMSSRIWRATGEYVKTKRMFQFSIELLADKESHVKERIYSEIGSKHRVKRRHISFTNITEIKPDEVTDLDLRRVLGVESEI